MGTITELPKASLTFEQKLDRLAQVAVNAGLGLERGQELVMTSSTLAVWGSMPWPTERSRSRSLSMPLSLPWASSTAAAPTLAPSRITEASERVMVVGTTTAGLCITSATVRDTVTTSV